MFAEHGPRNLVEVTGQVQDLVDQAQHAVKRVALAERSKVFLWHLLRNALVL